MPAHSRIWIAALAMTMATALGAAPPARAVEGIELTRPPDFKKFWKKQLDDLRRKPIDVKMTEVTDAAKPGAFRVWDVKFASVDGKTEVWGWYGAPPGASAEKKCPALLAIPAFNGRRGGKPPQAGAACGLVIGYRGDADEPWPKDWITQGLDGVEHSVFRIHYLNLVNAVRFLQSRPEVDTKRIYLQGGSMGGGLSVVVAGLLGKQIAGFVAGVPGMSYYYDHEGKPAESSFRQMEEFVEKQTPADKRRILRILAYYTQVNFAPDVTAESLLSCGGKDPLCTPKIVYSIYNHLGGRKEMKFYPEGTHGGGPGLSDDWPRTSGEWLKQRLE